MYDSGRGTYLSRMRRSDACDELQYKEGACSSPRHPYLSHTLSQVTYRSFHTPPIPPLQNDDNRLPALRGGSDCLTLTVFDDKIIAEKGSCRFFLA